MNRKLRNFFFGPQGSSYKKFSKQNEPDEAMFKQLFASQAFIEEVSDTAKTSEQGLIKLETDADVIARTTSVDPFSKAVRAHQLPELITSVGGGDVVDSTVTGRGISVKNITRTVGSITRRVWQVLNTLIVQSTTDTVGVTEPVSGTYELDVKITSVGGTVTPTVIPGGYNLEVTPGVGPAGEDITGLVVSNDGLVICDYTGTVTGAYPIIEIAMYKGSTQIDMSTINLADPTEFNPVVTNCTATYSHSGMNILATFTAITADVGSINVAIKYLTFWHTKKVQLAKVYAGSPGTTWTYKGELTTAPLAPSNYWWYKNPNTKISYFYESGTWKILFDGRDDGPTEYTILTNAGLLLALTSSSKQDQIIHVPAGVVLAGPITISNSGTFPDGWKFNVMFDGGFDSNGQAVTILGKSLTDTQCEVGDVQVIGIYSITDTTFKTFVFVSEAAQGRKDIFDVVKVTSASLLSCGATPVDITIVPAATEFINPGSGAFCIGYHKFGTAAYTMPAGEDLVIQYSTAAVGTFLTSLDATIMTTVADTFMRCDQVGADKTIIPNDKLVLTTTGGGDPTLGDGDLYLILRYSIDTIPTF